MNTDPIYEADGKISVRKAVPFGLQHVLAMFVANIAPILIVTGVVKMPASEAAISLGASDMTTFRKITVPMMMPGVLSGAIMSWVTIISELSSSIILYTNSTQTLTVSIYTEVIRGNYGNASAYATILTVTSILSLLLFYKVTGRCDVSV